LDPVKERNSQKIFPNLTSFSLKTSNQHNFCRKKVLEKPKNSKEVLMCFFGGLKIVESDRSWHQFQFLFKMLKNADEKYGQNL